MVTKPQMHNDQRVLVTDWYRQFNRRLKYLLAKGVSEKSDVQDLAQEVYLRLLRVDSPELIRTPWAYLYRIAIHVLAEWRVKERRQQLHDAEELDNLIANGEPIDDVVQARIRLVLDEALATLPASYRAVLVLHCQHHMTYREVANHLSITERMAKRYVIKGYAELRQYLALTEEQGND